MSDMHGKTVLITGATNGIGKVAALELAKMGATIVLVGRSREKGDSVVQEIKAASGNPNIELLLADLSSQAELRKLADEFRAKHTRLDVLINNAGAIFTDRQMTVDNLEMTFALNHLSYFLLTNLLLDMLKASQPSRIVNVSSDAHRMGRVEFDNLQGEKRFQGWLTYGLSKLANIMFTYELAKRLHGTTVSANVLHPGVVSTGFGHNNSRLMDWAMTLLQKGFGVSAENGARTIIYLASSPEVEGVTGKYFYKSKPQRTIAASYDEEVSRQLWEVSEQLTGLVAREAV